MGKLSYITNDPIADWNRYCAEQDEGEPEKVKCSVCGEWFEDEGEIIGRRRYHENMCPTCKKDIHERVDEILTDYLAWGACKDDVIDELFKAVEEL